MVSYYLEGEAQGRRSQVASADSNRDKIELFKRKIGHTYINTLTETDEDY
jgi:hypothetical protein